jgi:putative transposase
MVDAELRVDTNEQVDVVWHGLDFHELGSYVIADLLDDLNKPLVHWSWVATDWRVGDGRVLARDDAATVLGAPDDVEIAAVDHVLVRFHPHLLPVYADMLYNCFVKAAGKAGVKEWAAMPLDARPQVLKVRYNYRLRVNAKVAGLLKEVHDSCRFVWNQALGRWGDLWRYEGVSYSYADADHELTDWRSRFEWLAEQPSVPQQQVLRDLFKAVSAFFDKSNPAGRPKFKKKGSYKSARWTKSGFSVTGTGKGAPRDRLSVATRAGRVEIPVVWSRQLPSGPTSVTVYQDAVGHWYASFVVEVAVPETPLPMTTRTTGLDVGLTTLGTVVDEWMDMDNPRHLKRASKVLSKRRRSFSKRTSPKHKEAARHKVAKAEDKLKCARLDYDHKQAGKLFAYYDAVGYEGDLAPKDMARKAKPKPDPDKPGHYLQNGQSKKRGLNRSVADAAWGQFLRVLAFQAVKLGKFAIPYPKSGTTQDCSGCGTKAKSRLELKDRVFSCDQCGYSAPRDRNSARNLDPRRRGWTGRGDESTGALPSAGGSQLAA